MNFFSTSSDIKTLRYKTIGLTLLLLSLFITIQQYIAYKKFNQAIDEKIAQKSEKAEMLYNNMMKDRFRIQLSAIKTTLSSPGAKEAIIAQNRNTLIKLFLDRYHTMHDSFPNFNIMHFVQPNNHSLLRLHQLDSYGDDLTNVRPMHKSANENKMWLHGLEVGKYGISYRTVFPIVYDTRHYGLLEIGSPVENVIQEIEQILGLNIILTIKKEHLSVSEQQLPPSYDADRNIIFASDLFSFFKPKLQNDEIIKDNEKTFILKQGIDLYSFNGTRVGEFYYAFDITHELSEKLNYLLISVAMGFTIMLLIILILNYNFNKIIKQLNRSERYSHLILNTQQNIIVVTDGKSLIDANNAFLKFFGFKSVDDFKQYHQCICDFFEATPKKDYITSKMKEGLPWLEYILAYPKNEHKCLIKVEKKESVFLMKADAATIKDSKVIVLVLQDITKLELHNIELEQISHTDALTHIYNRTYFNTVIHKLCINADDNISALSIIFFDIDHFKSINDTFGHSRGDDALVSLASLVSSIIRNSDIFIRWGGEEFLLLLPDTKIEHALKLCEKLRTHIEMMPFEETQKITCSFGVTQRQFNENEADMIKRADDALYAAKENGRNRIESL